MKTFKLYDVCNDYSLQIATNAPSSFGAYKWIARELNGVKVELGVHKKHKEIHFARTDSAANLDKLYI